MAEFDRQVGGMIRALAARRRISMRRLAAEVGMPYSSLNERIAGRRAWQAAEIRDIARYLEVGADELLGLRPLTVGFESAWTRTLAVAA